MKILRYAIQHIIRKPFQSLSVVLILSVTFLIAQLFVVVSVGTTKVLEFFEQQPQVMIFFKDETLEDQILQIKAELEKSPEISDVTYISKAQAVEIYKDRSARLFPDKPELLEFVTADMLPASLGVSALSVNKLYDVSAQFEGNQFVESVIFQEDLVVELTRFTSALRIGGAVLISVLLFTVVVLMAIVVSNNIKSFSSEIEVMRLVGAGSWYIRLPFIIDGILFAVIATTLSTIGLYMLIPTVEAFSMNFIAAVDLISNHMEFVLYTGGATVLFGSVFTIITNYLATWNAMRT
ncbi:hypothetical protein GW793_00615 [bacterium]|nr:hypothetical protein [bacterium]